MEGGDTVLYLAEGLTPSCVCVLVPLQSNVDEEPEEMPPPDTETVQAIPGSELVWRIAPRPDNYAEVRGIEWQGGSDKRHRVGKWEVGGGEMREEARGIKEGC